MQFVWNNGLIYQVAVVVSVLELEWNLDILLNLFAYLDTNAVYLEMVNSVKSNLYVAIKIKNTE